MNLRTPYQLFLADAPERLTAKTSIGIFQWRPERCVAQLSLPGCAVDLGLPDCSPTEAAALGAKTFVVGVANRGGRLSDDWIQLIEEAITAGMDVVAGLHRKLRDIPSLVKAAKKHDVSLIDVRYPEASYDVGAGRIRTGKRVLTVGTDCSMGKMFTALCLEREMQARGIKATFRATGQTGIMIAGTGVPVDAVIADFISGAVESITPDNEPDHWDIIEGQGSLFHPSFSGVSLGLLHGSAADTLIMCHAMGREGMRGLPDIALPDLGDCIRLNERLGRRTNPNCRVVALSINTSAAPEADALAYLDAVSSETGLPATDPHRFGAASLVDAVTRAA